MKIIIRSGEAKSRTIKGKSGEFTVREQTAALDVGDDFPTPFKINLGKDRAPYPAGDYTLDLSSLYVGGTYGDLMLKRELVLVPLAAPVRKVG